MALTTCRECGHQVSDAARTCPSCGVADPSGHLTAKAWEAADTGAPDVPIQQRGWFRRHPVLTFFLVLFGIGALQSAMNGPDGWSEKEVAGPPVDSVTMRSRLAIWRTKAQNIPASNPGANARAYRTLVDSFAPYADSVEVRTWREKAERYTRESAAIVERFGPVPEPSAWDGGIFAVEDAVKQTAHDPGSVEVSDCGLLGRTDAGYRVRCVVRGKNAFGAMIRRTGTYTIRHGQVIAGSLD